jgi:hypothetical protein
MQCHSRDNDCLDYRVVTKGGERGPNGAVEGSRKRVNFEMPRRVRWNVVAADADDVVGERGGFKRDWSSIQVSSSCSLDSPAE